MNSDLIIAVTAGLGGMLGWGLADFFAKKTIDIVGDTVSLVWAHIFGTLALIVFAFTYYGSGRGNLSFSLAGSDWCLLIFFGILQGLVYLLVYRGFGKGQVAVLSPIFASFSGLTAILSIVFFNEVVGGRAAFALIVIFLGVILLSTDIQALRERRSGILNIPGSKEIFIATILAAFWTLFWDRFVGGQDWLLFTLFMYLFMTLMLLVYARVQGISLKFHNSSMWKLLMLIGICEVAAYVAISLGYSLTTYTSITALLSGAFSLPVIVLAYIFLNERVNKLQRWGAIAVILGIMFLAIA